MTYDRYFDYWASIVISGLEPPNEELSRVGGRSQFIKVKVLELESMFGSEYNCMACVVSVRSSCNQVERRLWDNVAIREQTRYVVTSESDFRLGSRKCFSETI